MNSLVDISQRLLWTAKKQEDTRELQRQLASTPSILLLEELNKDNYKLVFWINVYNAFIQIQLRKQDKPSTKGGFFSRRVIDIGGQLLSFDDIEHGILRRGMAKYGLGWIPSVYISRFVQNTKVDKLDFRIHFALNCGAKSCPPIAFYDPAKIEQQLDMAMESYLMQETEYQPEKKKLLVSSLFLWFMGDFGGEKGIRQILRQHDLHPSDYNPKISYKTYNWEVDLDNWHQR